MTSAAEPAGAPNRNFAAATALMQELAAGGVRHACVSPGSRSAPLAVAANDTPELRCWVHVDERSAGFFALGLAMASRSPVALLCTSGTAAANLLPALLEASASGVSLIALTADRPAEARGWGTPQTIDQVGLFGSCVRWFAEAPTPQPGSAGMRYIRALAGRALAEATGPRPGPVHLNLPYREPLDPVWVPEDRIPESERKGAGVRGRASGPYSVQRRSARPPDAAMRRGLLEAAHAARRGVIVSGPCDADADLARSLARLAVAAGWPVLADPTSQLRFGPHTAAAPILAGADAFLRDAGQIGCLAPDLVLRIGAIPTSKAIQRWLAAHPEARSLHLDPAGRWSDPLHLMAEFLDADPRAVCDCLAGDLEADGVPPADPSWVAALLTAEKCAAQALASRISAGRELLAPQIARAVFDALPANGALFLASSMAVRDADSFLPVCEKPLRVFSNRGANGIDGTLSSALGASAATAGPLALLIGDLALLHDLGGLLAARQHALSACVVVVNDDGGSIFSNLPIAAHGERVGFDALFRVRHDFDFVPAARAYGIEACRVGDRRQLDAALNRSLAADGVQLIEVRVDPEAGSALRAAAHDDVARALRAAGLA